MIDGREFFREVTLQITRRLQVEKALRDLFVYLRRHMPCEDMGMYYMNETTNEMRMLARVETKEGTLVSRPSDTMAVIPASVVAKMEAKFAEGKVPMVMIHGPEVIKEPPDPSFYHIFRHLEGSTTMGLHLRIENKPIGVLLISAWPPAAYTNRHARLLESVMEPIAIAFSNARRYEDLLHMKNKLHEDNRAMSQELGSLSGTTVIGSDDGLREVMAQVRQVAPMNSPVLLLGETGTGKEVMAHAIHALSPRSAGPFVRVQCGAIPETLLDSELFGHERGAFTGAVTAKRGRFERAHRGTIFLDEIGELTQDAQVKLLRVLQEKEFERLGGADTVKVDVRVIAATHRDLEKMVGEGHFREDLWFRLNVFPLMIPPLRDRKEDIPALVLYFMQQKRRELNLDDSPILTLEIVRQLQSYDWPGNVRELQNVIERALIVSGNGPMVLPGFQVKNHGLPTSDEITGNHTDSHQSFPTLDESSADHIKQAMRLAGGRIQGQGGAAELLGIQPNTLRAKMKRLNIPYGRKAMRWEENYNQEGNTF